MFVHRFHTAPTSTLFHHFDCDEVNESLLEHVSKRGQLRDVDRILATLISAESTIDRMYRRANQFMIQFSNQ